MKFLGLLSLLTVCVADQADKALEKLYKLSNKGQNVVALDSSSLDMITEGPRSYAVLVMYTALNPQFKCAPCVMLHNVVEQLQYSISKSSEAGRLFIGFLDYSSSTQQVFTKMNLQAVPHIRLYYPTTGPKAKRMEFDEIKLTSA